MGLKNITIKGAKENNLKNIDLVLPKDKLITFTGISGSGKSTLAIDTIYAEGQRRYMESLSSYARQFLGQMEKPDVDSIEGLSPAISIDQKTTSKNPRSTVGTVTEIHDYLRLLYARIGKVYCPNHNVEIKGQTVGQLRDKLITEYDDKLIYIMSKIATQKKGTFADEFEQFQSEGYSRVHVDGKMYELDEVPTLEKNIKHNIYVVVDRFRVTAAEESRLYDGIELASEKSDGWITIQIHNEEELYDYSLNNSCPECGFNIPRVEPNLFSFNTPLGACDCCDGLGVEKRASLTLCVEDRNLSLNQEAIVCNGFKKGTYYFAQIQAICREYNIDMDKPFKELTQAEQDYIAYGSKKPIEIIYAMKDGANSDYRSIKVAEGVVANLERRYVETTSPRQRDEIEKYMIINTCHKCNGARLNDKALAVKIGEQNINQLSAKSIKDLLAFLDNLSTELSETEIQIGLMILTELNDRLGFLNNVGLDYLSLSRTAGTLSGGEAQRIRLATQIGARLSGVLYVLDEPSIGLHQRDNEKLIDTLKQMRDLGNTLVVVEHDEDTMLHSDYIVEIGPGAGVHGGNITFKGTPEQMKKSRSLTGKYLSGKRKIDIPENRRLWEAKLKIVGASENNLKNIDVEIPMGVLNVITGVSGSGKSTLINQILLKELSNSLHKTKHAVGRHKEIIGTSYVDKIINIDQSPIGRTPRSNPATYTGVFDDIRDLFTETKESKSRGYKKGRFSFNVKGGRCEHCQGDGLIKIEMHFLPDVFVPCDVCHGKRYNEETLQIKYKEKNIHDILQMTIEEAAEFFENIPKVKMKLDALINVGLDYIKLGQSSTTLSGGEAQRVKLASELYKRSTGKTVYILDEPSTGLHFEDIRKLVEVIQNLVNTGNTVIIIEHNLDIIKVADYITDLGPEGGDGGGLIVAQGTPEEVARVEGSYTGKFLKPVLERKY